MQKIVFDVFTDLDPDHLNKVGHEIYLKWLDFATGMTELGGRRISNPTGKYASSIRYRRYGASRVAIVADENVAPEARILETGHKPIDMLEHLAMGAVYPMHRGTGGAGAYVGGGARAKKMWASTRAAGFSGFASTPNSRGARGASNTSGTGPAWTIPAMPAYSPAFILAELVRQAHGVKRPMFQ